MIHIANRVREHLKPVIITTAGILSICVGLLLETTGVIEVAEAIRLAGANRTPHDGWLWLASFIIALFAFGIIFILLGIYGFVFARRKR